VWQKTFSSVCPTCDRPLTGRLYEESGRILLEKQCPDHGTFRDLASSDAALYRAKLEFAEAFDGGCSLPQCRKGVAACKLHRAQKAPISFIEITPRCNMQCPVCYIDASAKGTDVPFEKIERIVQEIEKHDPETHVILIGGEPTLHADFFRILAALRETGLIRRTWIATNGITLGDEAFCRKVYEAGARWFYLAFDSTDREACKAIRGSYRSYEAPRKAIENLRKFKRARVLLSVTAVKGVNDGTLADVVRFAMENRDVVRRISISAEVFCGRQTLVTDLISRRITPECVEAKLCEGLGLSAVTVSLGHYGALLKPLRAAGLVPEEAAVWAYSVPHPTCGSIGMLFEGKDGKIRSLLDFVFRNPREGLARLGQRMARLGARIEARKARMATGGFSRFLFRLLAIFYYLPLYLLVILMAAKPSFVLRALFAPLAALLTGRKTQDVLFGRKRIELWYLLLCDKYNFMWDRMPNCATHHYRIDPATNEVNKFCGCYIVPFREKADSCHAIG